jgi:hypothetical protein
MRPLQKEDANVPLGFALEAEDDESGTGQAKVKLNPKTGQPVITWKSMGEVTTDDFTDVGPGVAMCYDFMREGAVFFFVHGMLQIPCYVLEMRDPLGTRWVGAAIFADLVFIFTFIIFILYLRWRVCVTEKVVERNTVTTSAYAVQLRGLPPDTTAEEVREFCSQFGEVYKAASPTDDLYGNTFDETGVVVVYDDGDLISLCYEMLEAYDYLKATDPDNEKLVEKIQTKIEKLEARHKELHDEMEKNPRPAMGNAYVVFEYHEARNKCLEYFRLNPSANFRDHLSVSARIAHDPSVLLWKNIGVSRRKRASTSIPVFLIGVLYINLVINVMVFMAWLTNYYRDDPALFGFGLVGPSKVANGVNAGFCNAALLLILPIFSYLERYKTRTKMEIATYLRCAVLQALAVYITVIGVFGSMQSPHLRGDFDWDALKSFEFGWVKDQPFMNFGMWWRVFTSTCFTFIFNAPFWGGGLPTTADCDYRYLHTWNNRTQFPTLEKQEIETFSSDQCLAFSLHDYGFNAGKYLFVYILFDFGFSHGFDLACPGWWIKTKILPRFCHFQRDLNKLYEGVDFKPYMRFQLLLKYVFLGCLLKRDMLLWVALCFFTSMLLERYCFVKYYRRGPLHSMQMMYSVVDWCMPAALIMHMISSFLLYGVSWSLYDSSHTPLMVVATIETDSGPVESVLRVKVNEDVLSAFGFYWVLSVIFVIAYLLPLRIWNFGEHVDTFGSGTQLHRRVMADPALHRAMGDPQSEQFYQRTLPENLSYTQALAATEDRQLGRENNRVQGCKTKDLNKVQRIEVCKFIPDPTRREFGMMFVN